MASAVDMSGFSAEQQELTKILLELGQEHIFAGWEAGHEEEKGAFFEQVKTLHAKYPGGLPGYVNNARTLLKASASGETDLDGFTPEVPEGLRVDYGTPEFRGLEEKGLAGFRDCACVLVAGGLGERLGYGGIKVALPTQVSTGMCYMELYAQQILSMQAASNALAGDTSRLVPLAIMTSGDTHARTEALLKENDYFGLAPEQVTLMKQEKVAALVDNEARFALSESTPYELQTKPHGHGDVHTLLHQTGLIGKWKDEGRSHVIFFQDTNGLCFTSTMAALGVSIDHAFVFNSICVPRKAKEAVGAIARLNHTEGWSLTTNVEYNQLEPLLLATLGTGDENDASGFSPFPGNINQLIVAVPEFAATLERTGGMVPEFVNPKYADASKTTFTKPTRLECMMQDLPKIMDRGARIGFAQLPAWTYSPVKNSLTEARKKAALGILPRCASEGELEFYEANCERLRQLGADVATPVPWSITGFELPHGPHVVLHPNVGVTLGSLIPKFPSPSDIHISVNSTLIVNGPNVIIEKLTLNGTLVINAVPGARVVIKNLTVTNAGWSLEPLEEGASHSEELAIRGFDVARTETKELTFAEAGTFEVDE